MAKKDQSLSAAEIEKVIDVVLGPEEDWNEAAAEYALRLYGADPTTSSKDARDLILRLMKSAAENGEDIPSGFMDILWDLTSKEEWQTDSIAAATRAIKEMQQMPIPPQLTAAMVDHHFRDKAELSKDDEKILEDLVSELLNEANDSNKK
jgi:hypothetical protein